jgi:general secretion pathway protein C
MQMRKNWTIRLATFAVWVLAGASMVFWVLKFVGGSAAPANAAVVSATSNFAQDASALSRGLGGSSATPAVAGAAAAPPSNINASRFVLTGVVAGQLAGRGIALIAVDGKGAKPYRVGQEVTSGVMLQSVRARQARLASGTDTPDTVLLELPLLASAIVGTAIPISPPPVPPAPPPPMVLPSIVSTPPVPAGAFESAIPTTATGQTAVRAGAIRQRIGKEVSRDELAPAGAGSATQ